MHNVYIVHCGCLPCGLLPALSLARAVVLAPRRATHDSCAAQAVMQGSAALPSSVQHPVGADLADPV